MAAIQPPPPAGQRLPWEKAPRRLREALEAWAGVPVREAVTQPSGFSPGVAARLRLADGRRFFVKAVGPAPNPDSAGIHRRELRVLRALPADLPAPRLRWSYDEGEDGWIALVLDDVEGRQPRQPWDLGELERVLDAIVRLGERLTPAPLPPDVAPRIAGRFTLSGWGRLLAADARTLARLDPWCRANLGRLAALEAGAGDAAAGETLIHHDIRADNLLLAPDRVWFLDWPHARVGAAWLDAVIFAPSVTMQGGPPPEEVVAGHPALRAADPDAVTAIVAALAGFFTEQGMRPPPPGLPTLRAFQEGQGAVAREWLRRRLR